MSHEYALGAAVSCPFLFYGRVPGGRASHEYVVGEAPSSALARFAGPHDGVAALLVVLSRVPAGRAVAAADVPHARHSRSRTGYAPVAGHSGQVSFGGAGFWLGSASTCVHCFM